MNNQFEPLEHGEVISIKNADRVLVGHHTFRVEELATTIKSQLQNAISDWSADKDDWFTANGIECEALRFGSNGWQKGRIRLCLEFCPDEGEGTGGNSSKSAPIDRSASSVGETLVAPIGTPAPTPTTPAQTPRLDATAAAVVGTVGAVGLGAAADALTPETSVTDDLPAVEDTTLDLPEAESTPVEAKTPAVAESANLPPIEEVVLVTDREPTVAVNNHAGNLDEISFDFNNDSFNLAGLGLDGKMDLELSDLAIDGMDNNDFIDFETSNPTNIEDIANAIDVDEIDRPENSGMLIDEVWSELHPSNSWPSINRG